jgi:ATP/maltotriose-dependent transcriptional regulator MalT
MKNHTDFMGFQPVYAIYTLKDLLRWCKFHYFYETFLSQRVPKAPVQVPCLHYQANTVFLNNHTQSTKIYLMR